MQEHPHLPKRERQKGWLPAILLSGAVHGVLFLGLFTVFQWQTRAEFVYAELWAPEDVSGGNDPTGVAERVEAPEPTPEPIRRRALGFSACHPSPGKREEHDKKAEKAVKNKIENLKNFFISITII